MQTEDQYVERTPDLVAKIRAMRQAAEKEIDRFTRVADYNIRRVVGQKAKASPVSVEAVVPPPTGERVKRPAVKSSTVQTSIHFAPAPAERNEDGEGA